MILIFIGGMLMPSVIWAMEIFIIGRNNEHRYISYKSFKKEFFKYNWEIEGGIECGVLISDKRNNHIIELSPFGEFNGKTMIINNPYGSFLAKRFIRKQFRKHRQ